MAKKKKKKPRPRKWISGAISRPGDFTKKAKRAGMTPAQYQRKVLANPKRYSTTTVRQANLRKTLVSKKVKGRR